MRVYVCLCKRDLVAIHNGKWGLSITREFCPAGILDEEKRMDKIMGKSHMDHLIRSSNHRVLNLMKVAPITM